MSRQSLKFVVVAAILFSSAVLFAQTAKDAAQQWRVAHEQQILQEFTDLLPFQTLPATPATSVATPTR
jgi:hypothetical protein